MLAIQTQIPASGFKNLADTESARALLRCCVGAADALACFPSSTCALASRFLWLSRSRSRCCSDFHAPRFEFAHEHQKTKKNATNRNQHLSFSLLLKCVSLCAVWLFRAPFDLFSHSLALATFRFRVFLLLPKSVSVQQRDREKATFARLVASHRITAHRITSPCHHPFAPFSLSGTRISLLFLLSSPPPFVIPSSAFTPFPSPKRFFHPACRRTLPSPRPTMAPRSRLRALVVLLTL